MPYINYGKKVTWTTETDVFILYQCDKCGEFNVAKHHLKAKAEATYLNIQRQATKDKRSDEAYQKAGENLFRKQNKLCENFNIKKKCAAPVDTICRKCAKKPFWTRRYYIYAAFLFGLILFGGFFMFNLITMRYWNRPGVWIFFGLTLLTILGFVIYSINAKNHIIKLESEGWQAPVVYTKGNIIDLLNSPYGHLMQPYMKDILKREN